MSAARVAVIGVGALGRHHARILSELPDTELVAVVDTMSEQGQAVAEACRTQWLPQYDQLYDRIDAVSIAVPTVAHHAVASDFLQRGIGVLVEKPLAATLPQSRRLVELASAQDALLQVGHVERFNPARSVAWNGVGEARYIRAERVSPYTFRSTDIGVVLDLMIHDLDLIHDLTGSPLVDVEAFGVSVFGGHEDVAQARLRFENGCIADLTASRVCPNAARRMQVWSGTGCTTVDYNSREVTRYGMSDQLRSGVLSASAPQTIEERQQLMQSVFGEMISVESLPVGDDDALTAELSEFVGCIRTGARPEVGGPEALRALETADRVVRAIQEHCWDGSESDRVGPSLSSAASRDAA